jgi:hypothetical protein
MLQRAFSQQPFSHVAEEKLFWNNPSVPSSRGPSKAISATVEAVAGSRELPDVTGFLVVVLVTLGLFVVPVGATIMQGPAIVASIFGR